VVESLRRCISPRPTGQRQAADRREPADHLPARRRRLMAETGNRDPNGLSVTGLGDLLVEGKYRLSQGRDQDRRHRRGSRCRRLRSDGSKSFGDNLPTVRGRLAVQYDAASSRSHERRVMLRKPRTIYDKHDRPAADVGRRRRAAHHDQFSIIGESYGRAGCRTSASTRARSRSRVACGSTSSPRSPSCSGGGAAWSRASARRSRGSSSRSATRPTSATATATASERARQVPADRRGPRWLAGRGMAARRR